jgi:hypothetical protein
VAPPMTPLLSRFRTLLMLLPAVVVACGGNAVVDANGATTGAGGAGASTSTAGAGNGTGGGGNTTGGGGSIGTGGGCVSPTVGESCSPGEAACQPPNPCCAGYEWGCVAGAWQQEGLECACTTAPFACGTTTCSEGFYCEVQPPGIALPDSGVAAGYSCLPLPAACAASPSCACLGAALGDGEPCSPSFGAMCTVDAAGNVTVTCIDA